MTETRSALTPTQHEAYLHLMRDGSLSDASGYRITTVRALEKRGLATLSTWSTYGSLMDRSRGLGWVAYPVSSEKE